MGLTWLPRLSFHNTDSDVKGFVRTWFIKGEIGKGTGKTEYVKGKANQWYGFR